MPKEHKIIASIPKLYKSQSLDLLMFAYVQGMQDALPAVNDGQALQMFYKKYNITDEDFSQDRARVVLSQMRARFYDV